MGECKSKPCCYKTININQGNPKNSRIENFEINSENMVVLIFENNAKYEGQVKDKNIRHGKGV